MFSFQKVQVRKTPILGQEGVCNITFFFLSTCVLQNVKSYRFFGGFVFANFCCFSKHYKIGILSYFQCNKLQKYILKGYYLVQV